QLVRLQFRVRHLVGAASSAIHATRQVLKTNRGETCETLGRQGNVEVDPQTGPPLTPHLEATKEGRLHETARYAAPAPDARVLSIVRVFQRVLSRSAACPRT